MDNFILTCCSTADLSEKHFDERGIRYVCFHFLIDDVEYPDDLGKSMSYADFYKKIAQGSQPTTAQVNVAQFMEFFEPMLKQGHDIIHVSLSSGISGSYNSACSAQRELSARYPDRKIYIVDSLGASSGYGLLMDKLADLRDEGKTVDEVHAWAEENKLKLHHWFFSTDLTSYIRGGRISKTAGMFGMMLGICPLLNMDEKGHLVPREKIRTKKRVISTIVERMKEHAQDGVNYSGKCYISNSNCYEDAQSVASLVEETFKNLNGKVEINSVGTVIGAHTGIGTIALFFWGDERED